LYYSMELSSFRSMFPKTATDPSHQQVDEMCRQILMQATFSTSAAPQESRLQLQPVLSSSFIIVLTNYCYSRAAV
jgi:hypothetical protein